MAYTIECRPSTGAPVAPCGSPGGVPHEPYLISQEQGFNELMAASPDLFAWAFVIVAGCWLTGFVIGSIIRVIRLA